MSALYAHARCFSQDLLISVCILPVMTDLPA